MFTRVLGIFLGCTVSPVAELNALSVLGPRRMLVTKAALDTIRERATAS